MALLGVVFTFSVQAQTEPEFANKPELPRSFLRILYTPLNLSVAEGADINLNIEWEKPLTRHLSFDLAYYRDFDQTSGTNPDIFDGTRDFLTNEFNSGIAYNMISSLSLGVNFYFKPDQFDGWYASVRMNNFLFNAHRSFGTSRGPREAGHNFMDSRPMLGFYLGYRKVFKNNFFIDGRVGYNPLRGFKHFNNLAPRNMDLRIGVGYQFKLRKKKK